MIKSFAQVAPQVSNSAWVDDQALVVGQVVLADEVNVWPMAVLRGDVGRIEVGARTNIQDGAVVHVTHASKYNPDGGDCIIGCDVTIGHAAVLHACTVGDEVLIGMNATVLDGALIESQVLIAAGSLVAPGKHLLSGYLYAGNPVRQVRPLSDKERTFFRYSAKQYVTLSISHRELTTEL